MNPITINNKSIVTAKGPWPINSLTDDLISDISQMNVYVLSMFEVPNFTSYYLTETKIVLVRKGYNDSKLLTELTPPIKELFSAIVQKTSDLK